MRRKGMYKIFKKWGEGYLIIEGVKVALNGVMWKKSILKFLHFVNRRRQASP
jgi:hypothetical protein